MVVEVLPYQLLSLIKFASCSLPNESMTLPVVTPFGRLLYINGVTKRYPITETKV